MKTQIQILLSVVLSVSMLTTFAGCSKKEQPVTLEVDKHDISFDGELAESAEIKIMTEGNWTAEADVEWVSLSQKSGKGAATIVAYSEENWDSSSRRGKVTVKVAEAADKNITILITQSEGYQSKHYAVGYGYGFMDDYANDKDVKSQVLDFGRMRNDDIVKIQDGATSSDYVKAYGYSASEVAEKLGVKVAIKGKYSGFHAQVANRFDKDELSNEDNAFANILYCVRKQHVYIEQNNRKSDILKQYLTKKAKEDLNNPSIKPDEIVRSYGTHVILGSYLGGKVDYSMVMNMTQSKKLVDVFAAAAAGYKFVTGSSIEGSVETAWDQAVANKEISLNVSVKTYGGSKGVDFSGDTNSSAGQFNLGSWESALTENTYQLCDFDQSESAISWICIADFCDDKSRSEEILSYILGDYVASDSYKLPEKEYYKFRVKRPTFKSDDLSKYLATQPTLIKQVKNKNGQVVAEICNEAVIDINLLVSGVSSAIVMYPVNDNNLGVNYQKGMCWDSTTISTTYNDYKISMDIKVKSKLQDYLILDTKNRTISQPSSYIDNIRETLNSEDYYLTLKSTDRSLSKQFTINYPLVKIGTRVWMRSDLELYVYEDGSFGAGCQLQTIENSYDGGTTYQTYFDPRNINTSQFAPQGWQVPAYYRDWAQFASLSDDQYEYWDQIWAKDEPDASLYNFFKFSNLRWGYIQAGKGLVYYRKDNKQNQTAGIYMTQSDTGGINENSFTHFAIGNFSGADLKLIPGNKNDWVKVRFVRSY